MTQCIVNAISWLCSLEESDPKTCYSYIILGFKIFCSGSDKTPVAEVTKNLVFFLTRYILLSTLIFDLNGWKLVT